MITINHRETEQKHTSAQQALNKTYLSPIYKSTNAVNTLQHPNAIIVSLRTAFFYVRGEQCTRKPEKIDLDIS